MAVSLKTLKRPKNRLAIAVPVALLLIFVLLYFSFHSVKQSLLIFSAVPMSAIGGVFALWVRGMNFSISAGVGFIALFGVAVLNGIVLIAEFNRLEKEGVTDITERIKKGLHSRLRPVIMTAAVASLGFLPMALSTSAGRRSSKTTCHRRHWRVNHSHIINIGNPPNILYLFFRKIQVANKK